MILNLSLNAAAIQKQIILLVENQSSERERQRHSIQRLDAAFHACLAENTSVKEKFGLDPSPASKFLQGSNSICTRLSTEIGEKYRMESGSMNHDVYFDAEEGEMSDFETSSDEYSMHEASESPINSRMALSTAYGVGQLLISPEASVADISLITENSHSYPDQYKMIAFCPRTKLPVPASSMENVSFMGILRNNVGKDLSTISMPIVLNEPINLLQKLCEELEYSELLKKAAETHDEVGRLCLIAGFVVSGYSSSLHRAARKPFNPLLGETYERITDNFKYISEKVSHHPPIMACHAESPDFIYHQDSLMKTKFWGKSMELNNMGTVHLKLPALGEHYVWTKVTTSMRNVFSTARYLEHHGTIKILSLKTGHYCTLTFTESGYFTSANNEVVGDVFSRNGKKQVSLWYLVFDCSGEWNHSFNKFHPSSPNNLEVIWRALPFPPDYLANYGFTQFAVELNGLA